MKLACEQEAVKSLGSFYHFYVTLRGRDSAVKTSRHSGKHPLTNQQYKHLPSHQEFAFKLWHSLS